MKSILPQVVYDPVSGILKIEKEKEHIGKVAVCTAGTADISVAEEAAQTAEYFGTHVDRIYDVGVSGMHRLFSRLDTIQEANCVVAVAGMEGALASVMGGLVKRPVIAVPTSVGYGASFHACGGKIDEKQIISGVYLRDQRRYDSCGTSGSWRRSEKTGESS